MTLTQYLNGQMYGNFHLILVTKRKHMQVGNILSVDKL